MASDFSTHNQSAVYQQVGPITATLVGGAAAAAVATLSVTPLSQVTITAAVTVAALTGLEVWVRGDKSGAWIQLTVDQLLAYGRSDAGTDITVTPSAASCFVQLDCGPWSDVQIKAASAGAAVLSITAGGK